MLVKKATWAMGIVAATAMAPPAQAEVFKDKSGHSACVLTAPFSDMKRADGTSIRKATFTCIDITDLPFPFDHRIRMCHGTSEVGADGKTDNAHGFCEVLSTKGDRASFWYVGNTGDKASSGRWAFINGTGAFAGIKGEGTYTTRAGLPGGGWINDWIGTWQTDGATASK
jgi:hypothetical protein